MKTTIALDDGRWQHTFRQSDIGGFRMCPEQTRLKWTDNYYEMTSDTMLIGTAVHLGIEATLNNHQQGLEFPDIGGLMEELLITEWNNLANMQYSFKEAVEFVHDCFLRWVQGPWYEIKDTDATKWQVEEQFDLRFASDEQRVINIQGTYDFFDGERVWDWKTGDGSFQKWRSQRYSVQPTFYAHAAGVRDFRFCHIPRSGNGYEYIDVTRTKGDANFLKQELTSIATLIEADLERWPLGPTDWWCSERWCSEFAQGRCRGEHGSIYPDERW